MPAFSLAQPPQLGHPAASLATRRSPTHPVSWLESKIMTECRGFGGVLEPRYIIGAGSLDQ